MVSTVTRVLFDLLVYFTATILSFTRVQPHTKGEELLKLFLDFQEAG